MKKISIIISSVITCVNSVFAQFANREILNDWAGDSPDLATRLSVDFYTKYCSGNFFFNLDDLYKLKLIKNQFAQYTTSNGKRLIDGVKLSTVENIVKMELAIYEDPKLQRLTALNVPLCHYKPDQLGKIGGDEHYEKLKWVKEDLQKSMQLYRLQCITNNIPEDRDTIKIVDREWNSLCKKYLREYGDVYSQFSFEEINAIFDYSLFNGIDEDLIKKEIDAYNDACEIVKMRVLFYCLEINEWAETVDREWKNNPQKTFDKVVSRINDYKMYYSINIPEKTDDEFFIKRIYNFRNEVLDLCIKDYCKLINKRNALILAINKIKFIKNRFKITDDVLSYGNVIFKYNQAENHLNRYKNSGYERKAEMNFNLAHNLKLYARYVLGSVACFSEIHSVTSKGKTIQVYPIKKDEKSRYIVVSKDYDAVFAIPSDIILPEECAKIDASLKPVASNPIYTPVNIDNVKLEKNVSTYLEQKPYSADTLFKIGLCYFWDEKGGVEMDARKAYEYFLDSAEKGNVHALYHAIWIRKSGLEDKVTDKQNIRIIDYAKKFVEQFEDEVVLSFLVENSMVYDVGYISKEDGLAYLWRLYRCKKNPIYLYALANHYYYVEDDRDRGISLFLNSKKHHSYSALLNLMGGLPEKRFFGMMAKKR